MIKENPSPSLSIILPVFNEAGSLRSLHSALCQVLTNFGSPFEIIYCDDGSSDDSPSILREFAQNDPRVRVVILRRNFGQTAAISAGIDQTRGNHIVLLDADFQNDPADIPALVKKLDEGYDIVSGWRKNRQDPFFSKKLPSRIANRLISWITGMSLHDHGCTLKAYRSEILKDVSLYGEMHRFIPIIGHWAGARVTEVEVRHHPRNTGKSKYSLLRIFKVLLDLPLLVLMGNYLTRPMHFFGMIGIGINLAAALCTLRLFRDVFLHGGQASDNGFLILAVFLFMVGIQVIMIGLLAELLIRVYHESQKKKTYAIREIVNENPSTNASNEPTNSN